MAMRRAHRHVVVVAVAQPATARGSIRATRRLFVRYHNAAIPTSIDADAHVIKIGGNAAGKPYALTMAALRTDFTA